MRWHSPHGVPARGARLAPDRMARAIGLAMDVGVRCRVSSSCSPSRPPRERVHRRALTHKARRRRSIDRRHDTNWFFKFRFWQHARSQRTCECQCSIVCTYACQEPLPHAMLKGSRHGGAQVPSSVMGRSSCWPAALAVNSKNCANKIAPRAFIFKRCWTARPEFARCEKSSSSTSFQGRAAMADVDRMIWTCGRWMAPRAPERLQGGSGGVGRVHPGTMAVGTALTRFSGSRPRDPPSAKADAHGTGHEGAGGRARPSALSE